MRNNIIKKILSLGSIAVLLVVSALIFCGCEIETQNFAELSTGLEGSTLTVLANEQWIKDSEMQLAEIFEAETGIHVTFNIYSDSKYHEQINNTLSGSICPDIFMLQSGFALDTTYHISEHAVDLSDEDWASTYSSFSAEQTSVDGKLYGMTYYDTTTDYYLIYNKLLFEQAGFGNPPKNWSAFEALCAALKAEHIIPIYEPVADGWHQTMLWADMGQVFEKLEPGLSERLNSNQTTFSENENMLQALEQLSSLAKNGYFGSVYMYDTFGRAYEAMASGDYAMCMLKPGEIIDIVASSANTGFSESDFGIMLLPICDNQYLNVHPTGPSMFINSASQNIRAAKLFFSYLASKQSIQYMIDNDNDTENLPFGAEQTPRYSAATMEFTDSFDEEHSGMVLQDTVKYFNEQWGDISAGMKEMFKGNISPQQLLEMVDENRAKLALLAGDPAWQ